MKRDLKQTETIREFSRGLERDYRNVLSIARKQEPLRVADIPSFEPAADRPSIRRPIDKELYRFYVLSELHDRGWIEVKAPPKDNNRDDSRCPAPGQDTTDPPAEFKAPTKDDNRDSACPESGQDKSTDRPGEDRYWFYPEELIYITARGRRAGTRLRDKAPGTSPLILRIHRVEDGSLSIRAHNEDHHKQDPVVITGHSAYLLEALVLNLNQAKFRSFF
jgi:hypothetical protein